MFCKIVDEFQVDFFRYDHCEYLISLNEFTVHEFFDEDFCVDHKHDFDQFFEREDVSIEIELITHD